MSQEKGVPSSKGHLGLIYEAQHMGAKGWKGFSLPHSVFNPNRDSLPLLYLYLIVNHYAALEVEEPPMTSQNHHDLTCFCILSLFLIPISYDSHRILQSTIKPPRTLIMPSRFKWPRLTNLSHYLRDFVCYFKCYIVVTILV
ncbi:unnamed protein product [Lathyrus oleraceus]